MSANWKEFLLEMLAAEQSASQGSVWSVVQIRDIVNGDWMADCKYWPAKKQDGTSMKESVGSGVGHGVGSWLWV